MTYPPPGGHPPPPGQTPPEGGPNPQMPPQPGGQYPGQQPMPGQQPPGQYPPQAGPYGAYGPPPQNKSSNGLVLGIAGGALALLLIAGLGWYVFGDDGSSDSATNNTSNSSSNTDDDDSPDEDPDTQNTSEGHCLTEDIDLESDVDPPPVDCDADEAFWEVVAFSDDVDGSVSITGEFEDFEEINRICGDEFAERAWTSWFFTYEEGLSGTLLDITCLEALPKEDAEGRTPKMPDNNECIQEAEQLYVVDCDGSLADWRVLDVVPTPDKPEVPLYMTEEDELMQVLEDACSSSGSTHYNYVEMADGFMATVATYALCLEQA